MTDPFKWPTPPQFISPPGVSTAADKDCLIVFNDGQKQLGKLIRFSPEDDLVEYQPNREMATQSVPFDRIKNLLLVHPLVLKKQADTLEMKGGEVFPASEKQSCEVEYRDGEKFIGETIGFVADRHGLYLFLANYATTVIRYFSPTQAIKDYQIGKPLGQMLVDEAAATKKDIEAGLEVQQHLRTQRIGDYLTTNQIVNPEQLALAIQRQKLTPTLKLGEALILEKLITQEQLNDALSQQKLNRKMALGEILVDMGVVDKDMIKRTLAKKLGIPVVNLRKFLIDPNIIKLVPENIVRKHSVMPLYRQDGTLIVAVENPMKWEPLDDIRFYTKMIIEPVMASLDDILFVINSYYGGSAGGIKMDELASRLADEISVVQVDDQPVAESDNTLVRLVNKMILDAYEQGVSDIHIETRPGNESTRIRFRKDGSLVHYFDVPANFRSALVSRLKIMCQLDISERRKPQDGKIDFQQFGPAKIELRVAIIPTANGLEDVVMRVLAGSKPIPLEKLGLDPFLLDNLRSIMAKPYGLFLICGPTGSGKTTTLHSALGYINTPERKIWTAEDPIEITQPGLRQVQMNPKIGWTFATAMRSFLRADPDVIMVGEMRDVETTKIGIEASLTGHLVLSTLHTNSAPESVTRLLDFGMDPFNFADALLGILAQRLARRLCQACRQPHVATHEEMQVMLEQYCFGTSFEPDAILKKWQDQYANNGEFTLYSASGCEECDHHGYKGRLGLYELLMASANIKRLIQTRATVTEIAAVGMSEGMRTLKQDGLEKILQGHTDMNQVRAVCS
jgi:type II secretory ATPase GspE/PulE/Tfp pilus assembly ATPase PilB-like protein